MIGARTFLAVLALASAASEVSGSALHQFNPRNNGGFQDHCAYVKTTIPYSVKKKSWEITVAAGICDDTVKTYIKEDAQFQDAIARGYDAADLLVLLTEALETSKSYELCNFPKYAIEDPTLNYVCGFTCESGFEVFPAKAPTQCKCPSGKTICNGQCVYADPWTGGCPSQAAGGWKGKREEKKQWWIDDRCPEGYSVCGVVNGGPKAWECVDTSSDLWSCGGCSIPFTGSSAGIGKDCTAITHASSVACLASQCSVHACAKGYEPSSDGSYCVAVEEQESTLLAALRFGLEHSPLSHQ